MTFALFDPDDGYVVRQGVLPHWYQPGVTYFITYRTADSVPQSLLRSWHRRRHDWLARHEIDARSTDWKTALRARPELEREFHATFSRPFMEYLDRGEGECPLADPELARIVAENLAYFDGDRYDLGDFIVMPNHVHLLVGLRGNTDVETQCRSWKKFSATAINRSRNRRGQFWQAESFDHLVRSPEQFAYFQRYIADNPRKAGLKPGTYLHRRLSSK